MKKIKQGKRELSFINNNNCFFFPIFFILFLISYFKITEASRRFLPEHGTIHFFMYYFKKLG